jgi:hypothetical protein
MVRDAVNMFEVERETFAGSGELCNSVGWFCVVRRLLLGRKSEK